MFTSIRRGSPAPSTGRPDNLDVLGTMRAAGPRDWREGHNPIRSRRSVTRRDPIAVAHLGGNLCRRTAYRVSGS